MTAYTNYVRHSSRPRFKPGEYVRVAGRGDKYMVESSEWNSIDGMTRYFLIDEAGRRSIRYESELVGPISIPADRYYKKYMQQQQQRLLLNSFYGINYYNVMDVKKVIFNDPATIVLWNDGTKTVVKCTENDIFDPEKGLAFCFLKKLLGSHYYKTIRSEVDKYDDSLYLEKVKEEVISEFCPVCDDAEYKADLSVPKKLIDEARKERENMDKKGDNT